MIEDLKKLAAERNAAVAAARKASRVYDDAERQVSVAIARYERARIWNSIEEHRQAIVKLEDRAARITADNPRGDAKDTNIMAIDLDKPVAAKQCSDCTGDTSLCGAECPARP